METFPFSMQPAAHLKNFVDLSLTNQACEWVKLPGDAGNRSYWRLETEEGSSFILMVMNEQEAFRSEEAQSQAEALKENAFIEVAKAWGRQGIRTPKIVSVAEKQELILLEDLGGELLYDRRQAESAIDFYEKALDQLILIQNSSPTPLIQARRYDRELIDWEFDHFIEYALRKRPASDGIRCEKSLIDDLKSFFQSLSERISNQEQVVVHRDFHSKNLCILPDETVGVIDFQDALVGPMTYDLVSLLRDAYVDLSESEERRLLSYYQSKSGRLVESFDFEAMAIQRNLKAVGRFFYIFLVKGKPTHLPYVKPCLKKALLSFKKLGQAGLSDKLGKVMAKDLADV